MDICYMNKYDPRLGFGPGIYFIVEGQNYNHSEKIIKVLLHLRSKIDGCQEWVIRTCAICHKARQVQEWKQMGIKAGSQSGQNKVWCCMSGGQYQHLQGLKIHLKYDSACSSDNVYRSKKADMAACLDFFPQMGTYFLSSDNFNQQIILCHNMLNTNSIYFLNHFFLGLLSETCECSK